jgi:GNAT superfamily N-acetyltransferase
MKKSKHCGKISCGIKTITFSYAKKTERLFPLVLITVPNLTHGQRPYALVENVITDAAHRKKGCASAVLDYARGLAEKEGCYKIMLMTGSKEDSTLNFYRRAGYNSDDKTAFIRWLEP